MTNLRVSLCLVALALTPACNKKDAPGDTGPMTVSTSTDPDGNDSESPPDAEMTSADTGDGDGDSDGDGGTETTSFVPMMDDAMTGAVCDPWAQDCPEGEKCVAYGSTGDDWDANKCVPVMGNGQHGDPCTYGNTLESTDDCGPDTFCWNVNMDGAGTCTPFCEGTPDDPRCEPGSSCTIANEGSLTLCLQQCDPLLQDCEGDDVCFYEGGGNFVCVFAADAFPTGEPCGFINDCAPGNVCLDATVLPTCADASCCGAFCDLANPTCATMGTECTPFFEEGTAPPGYEGVGVCIIPGA